MIKVVIVEDHKIVADGVKLLLQDADDIKVTEHVENSFQFFDYLDREKPDVIIMDIHLKTESGSDLLGKIRKMGLQIPVLMLSMYDQENVIQKAINLGANGYLLKSTSKEELTKAVKELYNGGTYFSSDLVPAMVREKMRKKNFLDDELLTKREIDIIKLLARGKTSADMADELMLSVKTINTHRRNIIAKLGVNNSAEAVQYAFSQGWIG